MKRYSIVRVDGVCPIYNDKNFNRKSKNFCYRFNCSNCLYGDTKEQLIKKEIGCQGCEILDLTPTDRILKYYKMFPEEKKKRERKKEYGNKR